MVPGSRTVPAVKFEFTVAGTEADFNVTQFKTALVSAPPGPKSPEICKTERATGRRSTRRGAGARAGRVAADKTGASFGPIARTGLKPALGTGTSGSRPNASQVSYPCCLLPMLYQPFAA